MRSTNVGDQVRHSAVVIFAAAIVLSAAQPSRGQDEVDGIRLVPLYRFVSPKLGEHFYGGPAEAKALAENRDFRTLGIVGYGAEPVEQGKQLVALRRWRDNQGYHYFANFLKRPNPRLKVEPPAVKVWKSRATGTVPVYASSNLNGRNIYFALSREALKQYDDNFEQSTGLRRRSLGVVFYMFPPNYRQLVTRPPDFAAVDWSGLKGKKYRYAADVVEHEGRRYLFYAGNIDRPDRPRMTDHLLVRVGARVDGQWQYGEEQVVISPGEDWNQGATDWDRQRVGSPSVVGGEFGYQRAGQAAPETYTWAMFYAALDKPPEEQGTFSVALAVAHELTGPWYKVGPIVAAGEGSERGANSPSALRLEHPSRVLLIHASLSTASERSMVRELDLSNASKPMVIQEGRLPIAGLATSAATPDTAPATGRFVSDPFTNRVWRIRASHPLATTPPTNGVSIQLTSIPREKLAAADGEWTVHADFHAPDYGFVRLFTPGFSHDPEGNVCDQRLVELIVSTATAEGSDTDWLSTYRIHSLRIDQTRTEGDDVGPGSVGDASDEP